MNLLRNSFLALLLFVPFAIAQEPVGSSATLVESRDRNLEAVRELHRTVWAYESDGGDSFSKGRVDSWLLEPLIEFLTAKPLALVPTEEDLKTVKEMQAKAFRQGDMALVLVLNSILPASEKKKFPEAVFEDRFRDLVVAYDRLVAEIEALADCLASETKSCNTDALILEAVKSFEVRTLFEKNDDLMFESCISPLDLDARLAEDLADYPKYQDWLDERFRATESQPANSNEELIGNGTEDLLLTQLKPSQKTLGEACQKLAERMITQPSLRALDQIRCFELEHPFSDRVWKAKQSFHSALLSATRARVIAKIETEDLPRLLDLVKQLLIGSPWQKLMGANLLQKAEGMANCVGEARHQSQIEDLARLVLDVSKFPEDRWPLLIPKRKSDGSLSIPRSPEIPGRVAERLNKLILKKLASEYSIFFSDYQMYSAAETDPVLGRLVATLRKNLLSEGANGSENIDSETILSKMRDYFIETRARPLLEKTLTFDMERPLSLLGKKDRAAIEIRLRDLKWKRDFNFLILQEASWTIRYPGPDGKTRELRDQVISNEGIPSSELPED